jgi:hypothetical protein
VLGRLPTFPLRIKSLFQTLWRQKNQLSNGCKNLPATSCHKPRKPSILKINHTRLKNDANKSLFSSNKLSHLILYQSTWRFPCIMVYFKIIFQVNKHYRLNTSRTTRSTQHSRQKIINTSRDSLKHQPSQTDKSTNMIHNHVTIMNHS